MSESEITCMNLKRTMIERPCAISESSASYLVSKRYVQKQHYQQEQLEYRNYSMSMISMGKTKKPQESFET